MAPPWGIEEYSLGSGKDYRSLLLSGDWGAVITLVVSVFVEHARERPDQPSYIVAGFAVADSLSGKDGWSRLESTMGSYVTQFRVYGDRSAYATARFVVPFGPHLWLSCWPTDAWGATDLRKDTVLADVTARVMWTHL